MGYKEVLELLEKSDEGKKLIDDLKAESEKARAAEARVRHAESKAKELEAKLAEFAKGGESEPDDADDDAPEPPKKTAAKRTGLENEVAKLQKMLKTMSDSLESEKKTRAELEAKTRTDSLRNDFGGTLREHFGKFGDVLAENLIGKGVVKLDETGGIIYETSDRIYRKEEAVELLKTEYKDYLAPKASGSNLPPPVVKTVAGTPAGNAIDEMLKQTSSALFGAALKSASQ